MVNVLYGKYLKVTDHKPTTSGLKLKKNNWKSLLKGNLEIPFWLASNQSDTVQ